MTLSPVDPETAPSNGLINEKFPGMEIVPLRKFTGVD